MDPTERGQLNIGDGFPRAGLRRPVDEFGLVAAIDLVSQKDVGGVAMSLRFRVAIYIHSIR